MESIDALAGAELAAVASIWVEQKRELVVAFGGTSMMPAIAPGQKVLLRCGVIPVVGQVAAYVLEDRLAVHRVVACSQESEPWVLTWGDANPFPDDPLDDMARLVGTIDRVERSGTMDDLPPAPRTVMRRAVLRFALPRDRRVSRIRARLSLLYRIRSNLALGPMPLARKIVQRVFC